MVLLESVVEPQLQSQVSGRLEQIFFEDFTPFGSIHTDGDPVS